MFNKLKVILLAIWGGITTVAAAVFYVLFKQKNDEKKALELETAKKENEQLKADLNSSNECINQVFTGMKAVEQEKTTNEKIINNAFGGAKLDNFSAGVDLLRK